MNDETSAPSGIAVATGCCVRPNHCVAYFLVYVDFDTILEAVRAGEGGNFKKHRAVAEINGVGGVLDIVYSGVRAVCAGNSECDCGSGFIDSYDRYQLIDLGAVRKRIGIENATADQIDRESDSVKPFEDAVVLC